MAPRANTSTCDLYGHSPAARALLPVPARPHHTKGRARTARTTLSQTGPINQRSSQRRTRATEKLYIPAPPQPQGAVNLASRSDAGLGGCAQVATHTLSQTPQKTTQTQTASSTVHTTQYTHTLPTPSHCRPSLAALCTAHRGARRPHPLYIH